MLSNPSGRLNLSQSKTTKTQSNNAKYFKSKYFYNNLNDLGKLLFKSVQLKKMFLLERKR